MEGQLLFKLGLSCDFNGRVNGRNIVNGPNRPLEGNLLNGKSREKWKLFQKEFAFYTLINQSTFFNSIYI
jgi:hypothetical protein